MNPRSNRATLSSSSLCESPQAHASSSPDAKASRLDAQCSAVAGTGAAWCGVRRASTQGTHATSHVCGYSSFSGTANSFRNQTELKKELNQTQDRQRAAKTDEAKTSLFFNLLFHCKAVTVGQTAELREIRGPIIGRNDLSGGLGELCMV